MRPALFVLGVALVATNACNRGPAPRDASNATVATTQAYTVGNAHAVREVPSSSRALDLLAAPDRLPEDRALDDQRQAADLLTFLDVEPGMRVAQLGCGAGYTTELLARAVGPRGVVFGQNAPALLARAHAEGAWAARLARGANANVVRVDRDLASPLPDAARGLDRVLLSIDYGALPRLGVDRDAMNHAVHLALKSGGRYVVLDRTPAQGPFLTDLHKLHTDESRNVRREVEAAGFAFETEGRFFRASGDVRDWDAVEAESGVIAPNEKADRFVLSFVRP